MLKVVDIEAGYGRIPVLKGVSLEVREGEIITLIGGNGAGKSTLMKTIIGVLPASSGSIVYDGSPIHRKAPSFRVRQGLVLVPEGRRILRRMSVYENLLMGAYARKDKERIKAEMETLFERFPVLNKRKHLSADVLSGGEQQMLAIGRALLARPKLLMMDEPSLGLSPSWSTKSFPLSTTCIAPGSRFSWWNRMPRKRFRWRIGDMSWRQAGSSCVTALSPS